MSDKNTNRQLAATYAERYGIPTPVFLGMIRQESGFRTDAVSSAGAQGLGQLMPGTARALGVKDPFDANQNLDGSARYLKQQYDRFGSWDLALAAYNAGPAAVNKYKGIPPYEETQNYVHSIMGRVGSPTAETPTDTTQPKAEAAPTKSPEERATDAIAHLIPGFHGNVEAAPTGNGSPEDRATNAISDLIPGFLGTPLDSEQPGGSLGSPPLDLRKQIQQAILPSPQLTNVTPQAQEPTIPLADAITTATPAPQAQPQQQPDNTLALSYGLTPEQIALGTGSPNQPALATQTSDPVTQQATRIAQSATGPLAQAISDYAQQTGGRNYIKDLVIRYSAAAPAAREAILTEAGTYGLRGLVQQLGQNFGFSQSFSPTMVGSSTTSMLAG